MRQCLVERVPMAHPGDTSGVEKLIAEGRIRAEEIVAIFGKTEGNGCVNDFTRAYAVDLLKYSLARSLRIEPEAVAARIAMVMSGGTEGGLSPHFLVIGVRAPQGGTKAANGSKKLAVGTAMTPEFRPEEIGRLAQVRATAAAVAEAMKQAAIRSASDVHWAQVKCPLLTSQRAAEARARGQEPVCDDTYKSMAYSRGASALGVAVALGEIELDAIRDDDIATTLSLWSGCASTSAGIELMNNEIVVLGNSTDWSSEAKIEHGVMADPIDLPTVREVLRKVGIDPGDQVSTHDSNRILAVLAKAEPSHDGLIRGNRHIMWDDSDINATRHGRALVGGVIAAAVGHTSLFVSGGAEHQGPDGGGPIAMIVKEA